MRHFFVGLAITAMLGIIPSQVRGNDHQISQSIVKGLHAEQQNNKLRGFNIDLEVDDGDVYLKGTVASAEQEKLALDIARRVDGVRQVYNELEIQAAEPTKTLAPVVARPTTKVAAVLSSMKKTASVSSRRHDSADTNAASEPIPYDSTAAATELAERIIARLKQEKAAGKLRGFSLDVEVDDGVAWLNGKVATEEQQNRVLEIARSVSGVKQVVNGMTITQPTKAPTDLALQIVTSLKEKKARGELRDFSVDVEVDHGIVWLTGYAANDSQQKLILDTARRIPGVTKVVNDLAVGAPNHQKAQQAGANSELTASESIREAPVVPKPLPVEDERVGSAVASDATAAPSASLRSMGTPVRSGKVSSAQTSPNPQATNAGRPAVQYVWVPANQVASASSQMPLAFAPARSASHTSMAGAGMQSDQPPVPINASVPGMGIAPARFDHPQMPQYAWPSYAPYPNYGAVTYPKQYSPMAWPYIGPFYPYPQVPLGWRKVELKWKDGWWQLDFKDRH